MKVPSKGGLSHTRVSGRQLLIPTYQPHIFLKRYRVKIEAGAEAHFTKVSCDCPANPSTSRNPAGHLAVSDVRLRNVLLPSTVQGHRCHLAHQYQTARADFIPRPTRRRRDLERGSILAGRAFEPILQAVVVVFHTTNACRFPCTPQLPFHSRVPTVARLIVFVSPAVQNVFGQDICPIIALQDEPAT